MISSDDALLRLGDANPMPSPDDIDPDTVATVWAIVEAGRDGATAPASAPAPTAPLWRRPIVAAAGAFVVTILILGIVALSRTGTVPVTDTAVNPNTSTQATATTAGPSPTTADPENPATVSSSSTTTLPPRPASLEITWQRVPTQSALEDGWIAAVAEGGPGFVAVGGTIGCRHPLEKQCLLDPAVWLSVDGADWNRVVSPSFSGEIARTSATANPYDGDQYFSDVVSGPAGIVAVGSDELAIIEPPFGYVQRPGIWWSADGEAWENVSRAETGEGGVFSDPIGVWQVALLGDRYVAVGGRTAWVSTDGRSWERHVIDTEPETGVGALIVWDGRAVAVGGSSGRPAVWISEDGVAWERILDTDFEAADGSFMAVAPAADGLISLEVAWPHLIPWRSTNGIEWAPFDVSIESDVSEFSPRSGLSVAAGAGPITDHITLITDPYALWGTADGGATWYQVGEFDGGLLEVLGGGSGHAFNAVNDLIVAGDRLLAVGKFVEWSGSEPIGGVCYVDPGDGSLGSCRADAAVWIGAWPSR